MNRGSVRRGGALHPETGGIEDVAKLAEILDDQVRFKRTELGHVIIAGQDGAGENTPVASRLDVVRHIPDEHRFIRLQRMVP